MTDAPDTMKRAKLRTRCSSSVNSTPASDKTLKGMVTSATSRTLDPAAITPTISSSVTPTPNDLRIVLVAPSSAL